MTIKAVLFDLDDTLIDTSGSREERARRAYKRLLAHGLDINWPSFWRSVMAIGADGFYRHGMDGVIADLGLAGTALGDECIGLWFFNGCEDLIALSLGCTGILDELKQRYRLGIITNGREDVQRHKFENTGIEEYFELFLPSGEVGIHKPEPKIFHIALERLAVTPAEAVFIGDHLDLDVIGAQEAGMRTIWYNPTRRPSETPWIVPDAIVKHLEEVPGVVDKL